MNHRVQCEASKYDLIQEVSCLFIVPLPSLIQVLTIHILELVFTTIVLLVFLLFLMRPFVNKTTAETKRIAELLSQLPPDIDVEALLQHALSIQISPEGAK